MKNAFNSDSKTRVTDTLSLLKSHRSIRRFTAVPIAPEQLNAILEAGQYASTSSFIQAVSVVRVVDTKLRDDFAELSGSQAYIKSCAEFLVFCADLHRNAQRVERGSGHRPDYGWMEQFIAATVDTALFAQNCVVAAESVGLGCCYIGGIRNAPERVTELLNLPELVYPVFGLCLGYPDQDPMTKPRLPLNAQLHVDRYQFGELEHEAIDAYDAHVRDYYKGRSQGKLDFSWSEQMAKQSLSQKRKFMKKFIEKQGFSIY